MFGQVPSLGGDGGLFFEALFFEEAGVVAVAGDEFVVGAGSVRASLEWTTSQNRGPFDCARAGCGAPGTWWSVCRLESAVLYR